VCAVDSALGVHFEPGTFVVTGIVGELELVGG